MEVTMADVTEALLTLEKLAKSAIESSAAAEKSAERTESELANWKPPRLKLTGLEKAYFSAVSKTGDLTSVAPSAIKAIANAERAMNASTVDAAVKRLNEHAAKLLSEHKGDKKANQFKKDIDAICNKLKGLLP
jgi:hypothetical protein